MNSSSSNALSGYTIGITADRRAGEQISLFSGRGADCVHARTVRTDPILPEGEIREATLAVLTEPPDFVIATTGIGVRGWIEAADALLIGEELREMLAQARIFVRGPKAHGAAVTAGLDVEWNAPSATTAEVVEHLVSVIEPGNRVAVQVDGAVDQPVITHLRNQGVDVVPIPIYRWSMPDDVGPAESLVRSVVDRKIDAITFTSRPAAENFVEIAERLGLVDEVRAATINHVAVCSIGSICSEGLHKLDDGQIVQPERFRLGALVMTLTRQLQSRVRHTKIGGHAVVMQGRQVTVGQNPSVVLAARERQVLEVLVGANGAVRSKAQLLDDVWGSRDSGPHVVEVTVGRLRRRLGAAGPGIETVMKRGYRASPD